MLKEKFIKLKKLIANKINRKSDAVIKTNNIDAITKDVLVLHMISQCEYATLDYSLSYKYKEIYKIDFPTIVNDLIKRELVLYNDKGYLSISQEAESIIKYYNCIIIMDKHPEYELTFSMFEKDPRWHVAPDNDIIWGIFNARGCEYERTHQWEKLKQNHINKAYFLYEEGKYSQAIEEFTTVSFLSTTGIGDDDIVYVYEDIHGYMNCRHIILFPAEATKILRRMIREKLTTISEIKEQFYNNFFINHYLIALPFYYLDIDSSWLLLENALLSKRNVIFGMPEMFCLRIRLNYNIPDPNSKNYFYNSIENQQKRLR